MSTWSNKVARSWRHLLASGVFAAGLLPAGFAAEGPAWWAQRGVVDPTALVDDYGAVNEGQVKHIAQQGYAELKAVLMGGAGPALDSLWCNPATGTDDYRAVNQGQLKALAKPFYDRLAQLNYAGPPLTAGQLYPWEGAPAPVDDYVLVNIGQVKNLFCFDLNHLAPLAPISLVVQNGSFNSVAFNWTAPADGMAAGAYDIYCNGQKVGSVAGSTRAYAITNLVPATTYAITVRARNASGSATSPNSLPLDFTADSRVPSPRLVAGGDQSLWGDAAGVARSWGNNLYGQLGDGTVTSRAQSKPVSVLPLPVISLAYGESHALAVTNDGRVYAWGDNAFGQLGDRSQVTQLAPQVLTGLIGVAQVAAGDNHSLALKADGTVWAWGGNAAGQLGVGTVASQFQPVQVPGLSAIVQIVAGARHSAALGADGRVWIWGSNEFGQLGMASLPQRSTPAVVAGLGAITRISSGRQHLLALNLAGEVWAWGGNFSGQLGLGHRSAQIAPLLVPTLTAIRAVAAGAGHSVALAASGQVYAWGENRWGQLGDGSCLTRLTPVALSVATASAITAGRDHTVVVLADASLQAWGLNATGQLGTTTPAAFSASPVLVSAPVN